MKDEEFLKQKLGQKNPFKAPEGYFEGLTQRLVDTLPEVPSSYVAPQTVTLWQKVKPFVYMAAFFAGAALLVRAGSNFLSPSKAEVDGDAVYETRLISDLLDNTMTDTYSLYLMLDEEDGDMDYDD